MSKPAAVEERTSSMPESPSAAPPHPSRPLSVKQPEWAAALTERQRRGGARRQSHREQARQHAVWPM